MSLTSVWLYFCLTILGSNNFSLTTLKTFSANDDKSHSFIENLLCLLFFFFLGAPLPIHIPTELAQVSSACVFFQ